MSKRNQAFHAELRCRDITGCLLPRGLYLNADVGRLRKGETVTFSGINKRTVGIKCIRKLSIGSPEFCMWLNILHGDGYTWERLERKWAQYCMAMGLGERGFSKKECWLVLCDRLTDEKWN